MDSQILDPETEKIISIYTLNGKKLLDTYKKYKYDYKIFKLQLWPYLNIKNNINNDWPSNEILFEIWPEAKESKDVIFEPLQSPQQSQSPQLSQSEQQLQSPQSIESKLEKNKAPFKLTKKGFNILLLKLTIEFVKKKNNAFFTFLLKEQSTDTMVPDDATWSIFGQHIINDIFDLIKKKKDDKTIFWNDITFGGFVQFWETQQDICLLQFNDETIDIIKNLSVSLNTDNIYFKKIIEGENPMIGKDITNTPPEIKYNFTKKYSKLSFYNLKDLFKMILKIEKRNYITKRELKNFFLQEFLVIEKLDLNNILKEISIIYKYKIYNIYTDLFKNVDFLKKNFNDIELLHFLNNKSINELVFYLKNCSIFNIQISDIKEDEQNIKQSPNKMEDNLFNILPINKNYKEFNKNMKNLLINEKKIQNLKTDKNKTNKIYQKKKSLVSELQIELYNDKLSLLNNKSTNLLNLLIKENFKFFEKNKIPIILILIKFYKELLNKIKKILIKNKISINKNNVEIISVFLLLKKKNTKENISNLKIYYDDFFQWYKQQKKNKLYKCLYTETQLNNMSKLLNLKKKKEDTKESTLMNYLKKKIKTIPKIQSTSEFQKFFDVENDLKNCDENYIEYKTVIKKIYKPLNYDNNNFTLNLQNIINNILLRPKIWNSDEDYKSSLYRASPWDNFIKETLPILLKRIKILHILQYERPFDNIKPFYAIKHDINNRKIIFCGDFHSSVHALIEFLYQLKKQNIFNENWEINSKYILVFTGDLVDRGPYSLECVYIVFALILINNDKYNITKNYNLDKSDLIKFYTEFSLKKSFNNSIILLNGNHEAHSDLWKNYGFYKEIIFDSVVTNFLEKLEEIFKFIPTVLFLKKENSFYQFNHGGLDHLYQLKQDSEHFLILKNFLQDDSQSILNLDIYNNNEQLTVGFLWNDFTTKKYQEKLALNESRKIISTEKIKNSLNLLNIKIIISGHQDFINFTCVPNSSIHDWQEKLNPSLSEEQIQNKEKYSTPDTQHIKNPIFLKEESELLKIQEIFKNDVDWLPAEIYENYKNLFSFNIKDLLKIPIDFDNQQIRKINLESLLAINLSSATIARSIPFVTYGELNTLIDELSIKFFESCSKGKNISINNSYLCGIDYKPTNYKEADEILEENYKEFTSDKSYIDVKHLIENYMNVTNLMNKNIIIDFKSFLSKKFKISKNQILDFYITDKNNKKLNLLETPSPTRGIDIYFKLRFDIKQYEEINILISKINNTKYKSKIIDITFHWINNPKRKMDNIFDEEDIKRMNITTFNKEPFTKYFTDEKDKDNNKLLTKQEFLQKENGEEKWNNASLVPSNIAINLDEFNKLNEFSEVSEEEFLDNDLWIGPDLKYYEDEQDSDHGKLLTIEQFLEKENGENKWQEAQPEKRFYKLNSGIKIYEISDIFKEDKKNYPKNWDNAETATLEESFK